MRIKFLILILLVIALFATNLFFGAISIAAEEVIAALFGNGTNKAIDFIITGSRLPQALTALGAGAGLGVAGLLLQTAFRNPLAGPSILGISSGASLGVAIVMLFLGGTLSIGGYEWGGYGAVIVGALAGSMLIIGILLFFSTLVKSDLLLLITGIMIGYLTSSVVTLLSSVSTAQGVQGYVIWGMGSFADVTSDRLGWFWSLNFVGLMLAMGLAKPLNLLLLGDNYASNLGLNVQKTRNFLLITTGLLTAVITAYCGPVSFIGMAVPHISRLTFRTDNHWILLPSTMLFGAVVALLCNVASTLPDNMVIPINALTPIVGVPVILYVIVNRRK